VREAELALAELVAAEQKHEREAILGTDGFKTLWTRSRAAR
jgi:hypothetical protein